MSYVGKKFGDIIKISIGGVIIFGGFGLYSNNEKFYKLIVMPAFHKLEPELAHRFGVLLAKYKIVPVSDFEKLKILKSNIFGINFENPVGVAAGYDKNGEAVDGLFKMGFSFVEVGSITPKPQLGNPKPRIFRLPEINSIINRYGFNSDGHDVVYDRLHKLDPPGKRKGILGVNLGKNKDSDNAVNDYVLGVKKFGPIADYLVINVSSPNTPGLRLLQHKLELETLATAVLEARNSLPQDHRPPILLKISPDLSKEEKENIAIIILNQKTKMDGLVISNTTISRPNITCDYLEEAGGLSGEPLKKLALQTQRDMAILTKGEIPIIAVGGISSGQDALERIYNGASLVQIYTALIYEGPPLVKKISEDLCKLLSEDGFKSISDAVGSQLVHSQVSSPTKKQCWWWDWW